jgi:hypothetical protein
MDTLHAGSRGVRSETDAAHGAVHHDNLAGLRASHPGRFKFYSQALINNLFSHPYTKIEFLTRDLGVSRPTASKYLEALAAGGFLRKEKVWREVFYINQSLMDILSGNIRNTTETKENSNARHLF